MDERAAKEYLIRHDERFRELAREHRKYESQLERLLAKPLLSTDEQLQETVIKKKKLALKDQMQMLIEGYKVQDRVV